MEHSSSRQSMPSCILIYSRHDRESVIALDPCPMVLLHLSYTTSGNSFMNVGKKTWTVQFSPSTDVVIGGGGGGMRDNSAEVFSLFCGRMS